MRRTKKRITEKQRGKKMINSQKMNPPQAVRFINTWLHRNDYSDIFQNDIGLLLSENRRITRSPNVIKYGRIAFSKDGNGRITYRLEDLQDLCNNILEPICVFKLAIKLAKASKAALTARKPYFDAPEPAKHYEMVKVSNKTLDRLLSELVD
jgi:hypothetical protein